MLKIDPEKGGLANTAKRMISGWTNLKNNALYFDPQTNKFELLLCSQGKRFYSKHPSLDLYILNEETLPSGNKIFYEFDEKGRLLLIKETNSLENQVLAWIKIHYEDLVHIKTSDGQTVEYKLQSTPSGISLLTEVERSNKPPLHYQYQLDHNRALLVKKTMPEGRFVQIDYDVNKVRSIHIPHGEKQIASVHFSYGDHFTEVNGWGNRKTIYRFDEDLHLIAIEQYLGDSLYRIHKKAWGKKENLGNLLSTSVADGEGTIFYHKHFTYDKSNTGSLVEEREYGDVIGTGPVPLIVDEGGSVTNQTPQTKIYSYFSGKNTDGFFQTDGKGTGVKYWYKKGTNLLLKKFILTKDSPTSEFESHGSAIRGCCRIKPV